jgi:hypothetical protein
MALPLFIVERSPEGTLLVFDGVPLPEKSDPDKTAWFRILCLNPPARKSFRTKASLGSAAVKRFKPRNRCYAGFQLGNIAALTLPVFVYDLGIGSRSAR